MSDTTHQRQTIAHTRPRRELLNQQNPQLRETSIDQSSRSPRTPPLDPSYQGSPGELELVSPDTLARRISNVLLLNWTNGAQVNLAQLSVAYYTELRQRGVSARFLLDTVSVHPQAPSARAPGNQLQIRSEQNDLTNVSITIYMPVNPVRNLFARASFEMPTYYLLRRMAWLLAGSVVLLLLTTGSFMFMYNTILRQKKLSEIKNDFINNMTHELKTPIATVRAAIDALKHFEALNDPKKTQKYLTISQNNLERLSNLVEKVLNLAVEENTELVINPEPINLKELVNELIDMHQLKAPKPVTFQIDIPADTIVNADRIHFANGLNNLIDNAINYSHTQVMIRIRYESNGQGWQLAVSDDGIGIPKMYQSAIFDRFFRVPTGDLHPVKGFGLGLAYVRQVIARHGGQVLLNSEPGKGSEFLLKF